MKALWHRSRLSGMVLARDKRRRSFRLTRTRLGVPWRLIAGDRSTELATCGDDAMAVAVDCPPQAGCLRLSPPIGDTLALLHVALYM